MTITATGRRHIVRALKTALRIRQNHAVEITERMRNDWTLDTLEGDMRSARFLVSNGGAGHSATLYLDLGDGYDATHISFRLTDDDAARWNALPLEEAYAIAAEVHAGRSQAMIDADDAMAADAAREAVADNDDFIDMDAVFGPFPESRDYAWTDGTVRGAAIASTGDHVVAQVELGFGGSEPVAMTMLPLFSGVDGLLAYVTEQIGIPARLSVGRLNAFDNDHPAGVDKSMPLLDMIIHRRDLPSPASTLRRAA